MNNDPSIYALRGPSDNDTASKMLFESLKNGEGRFGWSYIETADLCKLREKIDTGGSLSEKERDCNQSFLLDLKKDDYVVYINVPKWGRCTLARVTGEYFWKCKDKDFNHRFPVDPDSVHDFDRNDSVVHPWLSQRLKLQRRWWRIDGQEKFEKLVKNLQTGDVMGKSRTSETSRVLLNDEIQPFLDKITETIHKTHPNKDLERLLAGIFRKVPCVRDVEEKGGRGDCGADLLVHFEATGMPLPQQTCVVQVKSFEGEHSDTRAVDDIKRALMSYSATMGLIVSTASSSSNSLDAAIEKLQKETEKSVSLLIGKDVAEFVLRFGTNVWRE